MKKIILLGFISMVNVLLGQEVTSSIVSSWETGYSGEIRIQPTESISNWEVKVQYRGTVNSLWNGIYTDEATNISGVRELVITPESYNKAIEANGIISIGFGVTRLASEVAEIINVTYEFSTETIGNGTVGGGNTSMLVWEESSADSSNLVLLSKYKKVGIGTDRFSTGHSLFVSGGIMTDKVKVAVENSSDWPDYVFTEGYVLMPLSEVEAFIEKNKHLPNVPSAKEVKEGGQDLAEMNKVLLQKVEELTLHMIRLQKEMHALKKTK